MGLRRFIRKRDINETEALGAIPAVNPMGKTKGERLKIKGGTSILWKGDLRFYDLASFLGTVKMLARLPGRAMARIGHGFCDRDMWDISHWFTNVMPGLLLCLRDNRHGSPYRVDDGDGTIQCLGTDGDCHEEWTRILNRMIFLLREMNEETCQKKNPYEEEHGRAYAEFSRMYGMHGEKLNKDKGARQIHFMSEIPEYEELARKYEEYETKIWKYRNRCKDEFFKMFSRYFWQLWD